MVINAVTLLERAIEEAQEEVDELPPFSEDRRELVLQISTIQDVLYRWTHRS